jgi:hypothetical protein
VSVPYLDKYQYHGEITQLVETTYTLTNGDLAPIKKASFQFTKNGRVKASQILDVYDNTLMITEKKLWFEKQSFPDRKPYYCKMRWKTKNRERISCYTQKQYKQNEKLYHYNDQNVIEKIEDHFPPFYTQYYRYTNQKELAAILIKNQQGQLIDSIVVTCKTKDRFNNCTTLEKNYTLSDSLLVLKRHITYK